MPHLVDHDDALGGCQAAWCKRKAAPYLGAPAGTIKRHATGKGNAPKEEVIRAVRARGFMPKDDNKADALALLAWAIANEIGAHDEQAPVQATIAERHRGTLGGRVSRARAQFAAATLALLRQKVPENWPELRARVTDNFRVISPKEFRLTKSTEHRYKFSRFSCTKQDYVPSEAR